MKIYSFFQRYLHKLILSPKFLREATFNIECSFVRNATMPDNHVFICGLARSGSTSLLNTLHDTNEFSSLTYVDMPFIFAPNLWSNVSQFFDEGALHERAHKDGIKVSNASPEAFEEIFWNTFSGSAEIQEQFYRYVNNIIHKYKKPRYLSKNNHNIKRLKEITGYFPSSHILVPFREPYQQAASLLHQHLHFCKAAEQNRFIKEYMLLTGHTEFGPNYCPVKTNKLRFMDFNNINHWIEQWTLAYSDILDVCSSYKNIHILCFEKMYSYEEPWDTLNMTLKTKCNGWDYLPNLKHVGATDIDKGLISRAKGIYEELSKYSI
ncbi:sulfotransferase [Amylibacter sp.]|nr:sulfotransferase [Amylibacter sp.]